MSVQKRIQAFYKEYEASLENLTFNSRVLIESLTILADKNKVYAPYIVHIVEKRISKVSPEHKLPVLYLLDSIMKNLGGEYLQLFSKNIVATFCHTFEKVVDPKKRISLFKLRQTWNGIIPARKLIAIDKHVHSIDSGWPVMPEPPSTPQSPTIFVNPNALPKSAISGSKGSKVASGVRVRFIDEEQAGPATKRSKEDNHLAVNTGPSPLNIRPHMRDLDDLPEELIPIYHKRIKQQVDNQLSTGQINRDEHSLLVENIDKYYELQKKKLADKLSPDKSPLKETPLKQPPEEMQFTGQQNVAEENRSNGPPSTLNILEQIPKGPVNMSDLLSKLVKTGLLPQQQPTDKVEAPQVIAPPTNTTQAVKSMDEHLPPAIRMNPTLQIPDLHLTIPHLKQFYPSLVDLLYAGEQCSQCGLRFTEVANIDYRSHLDWHFQLNRKDKDGLWKISRNWFIHPDDWYALKEGEQIEDKVKSNIFEQEQLEEEWKIEDRNISCKALPGEGNEPACHLCGESFELFWKEDLEEWHFKGAVRTFGGILYHGDCQRLRGQGF